MKRFAVIMSVIFLLTGCSMFTAYDLSDVLPPLYNIETQYAYVEKITVTSVETGISADVTELFELERIIAQFEGMLCTRTKNIEDKYDLISYEITFSTTDGSVILYVIDEDEFIIDEYYYKSLQYTADLLFLRDLTSEK